VEKFEARTGKKLTKTQLKNKWDSMKKEYTWFMELRIAACFKQKKDGLICCRGNMKRR
jgi:hypothetical protein